MKSFMKFAVLSALACLAVSGANAADGNADAGKKIFARCAVCHGIGDKKGAVGPSLNGVIGRTAGTLEEYKGKYSKPMIAAGQAGLVWSQSEIMDWVTDPKKKIPGTKMLFPGLPKEQDRADVAAYVATFSK